MLWVVLVASVLFLAWRYVTGTNEKWVLMNNIILAKLTYERLSPEARRRVDEALRARLRQTPGWGEDIDDLRVEEESYNL